MNTADWTAARPDEVAVLATFVANMRRELAANSGKGDRPGWMGDTPRSLLATHRARMSPASALQRHEPRPCKSCGREIQPGQLYVVAGPVHVFCSPPARLNVHLVVKAAKRP